MVLNTASTILCTFRTEGFSKGILDEPTRILVMDW